MIYSLTLIPLCHIISQDSNPYSHLNILSYAIAVITLVCASDYVMERLESRTGIPSYTLLTYDIFIGGTYMFSKVVNHPDEMTNRFSQQLTDSK
ncbi:MAG: hypothetical protein CMF46_05170 [Legionellales bacterium]|nr:hypothetical protein [Legionellales bacterium]